MFNNDHIEMFLNFLKENGAYKHYIQDYYNDQIRNHLTTMEMKKLLRLCNTRDFLANSFTWEDTSEGHDYWNSIDKKWIEICDSKEILQ